MRKIAMAALSVMFFAAGAQAKDMSGVIDLSGKVIIPFKYKRIRPIGDWLFVCENFNSVPGGVSPKLPEPSITASQAKGHTRVVSYGGMLQPIGATVLFDKGGKPVPVNIPAGLVVCDVHIPSKYKLIDPVAKLQTDMSIKVGKIPADALLTVIGKNGCGLVDGTGAIVLEPTYSYVSLDGDVKVNLRKGAETEPTPIRPGEKFDLDLAFQRSLRKETPEGQAAFAPHEGLVRFSEKGLFGFKDTSGKVKIPAKFYAAREFSCGYAPVRLNPFSEDGRYVYIDHNGKTASKEYFRACPFVGKTAIISMYSMRSLTHGLIDNKFAYIQEPYCNGLTRMKDGLVVPTRGMIHKVFDMNGKPVFDLPFSHILVNDGADGLVFHASEPQGKEVLVVYDTKGKVIKSSTITKAIGNHRESYHADFSRGPNRTHLWSVQTFDGKTVMGPTEDVLTVAAGNLVIKTVLTKNFSKEDWNDPGERERAFNLFIRQYKGVGMPKAEVEKYLGKGKDEGDAVISYDLSSDGTGKALGVVRYKDGKVEAIDARQAAHTKNGLIMPNPHSRFVPITVDSKSGFKYPAYMEIEPGKGNSKGTGTLHIRL